MERMNSILDEALELQEALEVLQPKGNPETMIGKAEEACHAIVALHDMWEEHSCCPHHEAMIQATAAWMLEAAKKCLKAAGDQAMQSELAN